MGTIAEKLRHLAETKTAIKNAITAKGVAVSERDTFRSYATKIGQINKPSDIYEEIVIPPSNLTNIYFKLDFVDDNDSFNIMLSGDITYSSYDIEYNVPGCYEPPVPGLQPDVYTTVRLNTFGIANQALVHIHCNSVNWTLHVTSSSPNVKITLINKDYHLVCSPS